MHHLLVKREHARKLGFTREGFHIQGHDVAWVNLKKGTYLDAHSADWAETRIPKVRDLDTLSSLMLLHVTSNYTAMQELLKEQAYEIYINP